MGADAPVEELHLVGGVGAAVDAAEANEAAAVDQLILDGGEAGAEDGQREVVLAELQDVVGTGERVAQRGVELGELGRGEVLGPGVLVGDVGGGPLALWLEDAGSAHRVVSDRVGTVCWPRTSHPEGRRWLAVMVRLRADL